MRKIKYLIITLLMLIVNVSNPLAIEKNIVDFSEKGEVTITLMESTESIPLENVSITIYQIALATEKNHQLTFNYVEELSNCNVSLSDLSIPDLAKDITKCLENKHLVTYEQTTDKSGKATFFNLELGLYLVSQTSSLTGYSTFENFLVMIPEEVDNMWQYSVIALPKTEIIKVIDLTVKKVWNNNNYAISDFITVNLLKDESVIDTIKLNDENNWTHTWTNLPQSDEYSVQEVDIPKGYQATYRFENNTFIITNTNTLVQTGNNLVLIEFLALFGIIFIIIGIVYEKRIRHE